MTLLDALKYFGSDELFREAMKISKGRLKDWARAGYIPPLAQQKLQNISQGELIADCQEQRT